MPGQPVDNRVIQYFAYHALGENFNGAEVYDALATSGIFLSLPDHRWLLDESLETIRAQWRVQGDQVADLAPDDAVAEQSVKASAIPLEITADDQVELRRYFEDREEIIAASDLLTNVLEVRAGSRTFTEDLGVLTAYLRSQPESFLWVGSENFRAPGTLPPLYRPTSGVADIPPPCPGLRRPTGKFSISSWRTPVLKMAFRTRFSIPWRRTSMTRSRMSRPPGEKMSAPTRLPLRLVLESPSQRNRHFPAGTDPVRLLPYATEYR